MSSTLTTKQKQKQRGMRILLGVIKMFITLIMVSFMGPSSSIVNIKYMHCFGYNLYINKAAKYIDF